MEEEQIKQIQKIERQFIDAETEYETGIPVLPGWAALGNVASQYGLDDDPFVTMK